MKNWNNVGPVTVVTNYGNIKYVVDNLFDAVCNIGPYEINRVNNSGIVCTTKFWLIYGRTDLYVIYDELGLLIPRWKILEVWNSVERNSYGWPIRKNEKNWNFRDGPVPYMGKRIRRKSKMKIFKNMKQNYHLDELDDDADFHNIKSREKYMDPWYD